MKKLVVAATMLVASVSVVHATTDTTNAVTARDVSVYNVSIALKASVPAISKKEISYTYETNTTPSNVVAVTSVKTVYRTPKAVNLKGYYVSDLGTNDVVYVNVPDQYAAAENPYAALNLVAIGKANLDAEVELDFGGGSTNAANWQIELIGYGKFNKKTGTLTSVNGAAFAWFDPFAIDGTAEVAVGYNVMDWGRAPADDQVIDDGEMAGFGTFSLKYNAKLSKTVKSDKLAVLEAKVPKSKY